MKWCSNWGRAAVLLGLLTGAASWAATAQFPGVAIVRTAGWSPGGEVREGAAELLLLMEITRLRQAGGPAGLVAVGDRRGLFPAGAEEVLRDAVLHGVSVVKLASGGRVLAAPHGFFLDGGGLSEAEAAAVLDRCLRLYGAVPTNTTGSRGENLAKLRDHLRLCQQEFTLAASPRVATR
jgi:hypothetical protein